MDNYFPSIALFERLRDLGIGGCGTAKVRKTAFPPQLHDDRSSLPRNELSGGPAGNAGKVLAVQWQDQSAVDFLTTIHNLEDRITVLRKKSRQSSSNGPAIRKAFGAMERANVPISVNTNDYTLAKKQFSLGATVLALGCRHCALRFLLASTAHTWSQHPGCAQKPPEQYHIDVIHLMHPEGQLCTTYTRRHRGNQAIRGIYRATN